jgi:hypothetical protein
VSYFVVAGSLEEVVPIAEEEPNPGVGSNHLAEEEHRREEDSSLGAVRSSAGGSSLAGD